MTEVAKSATVRAQGTLVRPDFIWSLLLFAVAAATITVLGLQQGLLAGPYGWGTGGFFLLFGLFTITMGFPHPGFGHV
ncbi:MAG: hypothetical protein RIA65_00610, partial [Woeseia sp.]